MTGIAFIWGTIFYLKYDQAKAAQADDLAEESPTPTADRATAI